MSEWTPAEIAEALEEWGAQEPMTPHGEHILQQASKAITTQQEQIKALSEALIATHTQVYNARECVGDDERMEYLANASNIIGAALTQQGAE